MLHSGSWLIRSIARRYFSIRWRSRSDGTAMRDRSQLSCRSASLTRRGLAWSRVWPNREATSPACRSSKPMLPPSDSNSCARSFPASILANVGGPAVVLDMHEVQAAARALRLAVIILEIHRGEDIAPAFEALNDRAQALYVVNDPLVDTHRLRINTLALAARLPTMYGSREHAEAGGLMSYGADFGDMFRRAAVLVDKILKGASPAALPVEQPTKFELVLNLKTAAALGLTFSQTLLARADEVIE